MAQPLLQKSNLPLPTEHQRHQVLSVSELLRKFQIKSPSHKLIVPTLHPTSSKNLLGSPKAEKLYFKKSIETEFKAKTESSRSESRQGEVSRTRKQEQMRCNVHEITLKNMNSPKGSIEGISKSASKVICSNSTSSITKQKQHILRKIHKELTKINLSSQTPKIPPLKLQQQKYRPPMPLSDRDLNCQAGSISGSVSARSHLNIKLPTRTDYDAYTTKNSKQISSINCFRKESNASTLSLRSKYTASVQHLEDCEELFPRTSSVLTKEHSQENNTNTLEALRDVKAKIYQQIDSLDKKLLQNTTEDKNRLIKIICRKKKREKGPEEAVEGTKPQSSNQTQSQFSKRIE